MQREKAKKKSSTQQQEQHHQLCKFGAPYYAFIDSSCNDRTCKTCGQDHSFRPSFDGIKTLMDVAEELCDSYASAFIITRGRRRVVS